MKKSIFLALSFVSVLLFITGCGGGKDSGEACKYEAIKLVDAGSYDAAIAEANSCSAFTANERRTVLADAYMGKAGFSVTDVISSLSDANTDFTDAMMRNITGTKLTNLEKANEYYNAILNGADCNTATSKEIKDACFASGLAGTVKASAGIGLLFSESDTLDAFINFDTKHKNLCTSKNIDKNATLDETEALSAATSAMPGAGTAITINSVDYNTTTTTISRHADCTSQPATKVIKHIFQMVGASHVPILTEGYCTTAGATCSDVSVAGCYPCPITKDDGSAKNMADVIVNVFNQDIGKVAAIAGAGSSVKTDIEKVKNDICSAGSLANGCTITVDAVNAYLKQ